MNLKRDGGEKSQKIYTHNKSRLKLLNKFQVQP